MILFLNPDLWSNVIPLPVGSTPFLHQRTLTLSLLPFMPEQQLCAQAHERLPADAEGRAVEEGPQRPLALLQLGQDERGEGSPRSPASVCSLFTNQPAPLRPLHADQWHHTLMITPLFVYCTVYVKYTVYTKIHKTRCMRNN